MPKNTNNVPLIGGVTEQKLIITFSKRETGEGDLTFDFEPPIVQAISPEQRAAVNVAEQVIKLFGLQDKKDKEKKDGKIIIQ
jgi:hypothetical protein